MWRRFVTAGQELAVADETARTAHGSLAEQEIAVWVEEQRQLHERAEGWLAGRRLRRDQRARLRRLHAARERAEREHALAEERLALAVRHRDEAENELRLLDAP
ncbi:hypothetical protein GCM10009528_08690 [Kineococcus aurantiacus]